MSVCLCARARARMYDTDQCRTHLNSVEGILFLFLFYFYFLGGEGVCLSVWCFGTVLYVCIEYHIQVNMYHVSAQGVDERVINVHSYYNLIL